MTVREKLYEMRGFIRIYYDVRKTYQRAKKNYELNPCFRNEENYNNVKKIYDEHAIRANNYIKWFNDLYMSVDLPPLELNILFLYFHSGYSMDKISEFTHYSIRTCQYHLKSLLDKIDDFI